MQQRTKKRQNRAEKPVSVGNRTFSTIHADPTNANMETNATPVEQTNGTASGDAVPDVKPRTVVAADIPAGLLSLPESVQQQIKEIAVREGFTYFVTKVSQGESSGEIATVTLTGDQTRNGVVHADSNLSLLVKLNGEQYVVELIAAASTGLLSLPESVQQEIKEIAVREGFIYFETKVSQTQNSDEIAAVTLTGDKTSNGVVHADTNLSLVVKLPLTNDGNGEQYVVEVVNAATAGLLSLPESVQQDIKEIAVREGFTYFETKVAQGGEVAAVTLTGDQTRNGVVHADTDLSLIVKPPTTNAEGQEQHVVELIATEPQPILTTFTAPITAATADISITPAPVDTPAAVDNQADATASTGLLSLPEYVQTAIKEIAAREGFAYFETTVSRGQNTGDGFIGEIATVTLTGEQTRNGVVHADTDLSLIVKLPPTSTARREFAIRLFEREVFIYSELLPAFERFQLEHGLRPGQAGFHSFPRCYHAHFDQAADQAVLILENLTARGFAMESKYVSIKFEYARTVLEKLAELHGISLAMRQQRPAEFERFKLLGDVMAMDNEQAKEISRTMLLKSAEQAVKALEPAETVLSEKVLRTAAGLVEEADRYRGENSEPYSVINHGDCWVNNMMFKHVVSALLFIGFYGQAIGTTIRDTLQNAHGDASERRKKNVESEIAIGPLAVI